MKDAAADGLVGQLAEPPLNDVQPRTGRRREVQMEAWMFREPFLHVFVLVRRVAIEDQMDLESLGALPVDRAQEPQELCVPGAG